jgi:S-formylglutathione hydrolase FrmB
MNLAIAAIVLGLDLATNASAWRVHELESPYQSGRTEIRVLLPKNIEPARRYPVVYVLPVEAERQTRFGDGLEEIARGDLQNKHQAIFAAPTFSQLPWYADHPTDAAIRQESHFIKIVLPMIESIYPVQEGPSGRLLLGFSKSGWGAWSLVLRHPELFARAAAWDAPLMMDRLGRYGTTEIFGTQEVFENYRIDALLQKRAALLKHTPRLILTGYGNFREHHEQARKMLDELKIAFEYRDGPLRKHDWHSGWVAEAVALLVRDGTM